MGLLSSSSASRGFGKAVRGLQRIYRPLGVLCYLASLAGLCLLSHNQFNGKTYFSENALQPGVAASTVSQGDMARYESLVRDLTRAASQTNGAIPVEFLDQALSSLGLESHQQNFSVSHPFSASTSEVSSGHNVFGIVRAPRIASTEALVLVAAWRSDNVRGVAHIVMMGALMKKQAYWAKDIIVLIVDQGVWGTEAWLQAYHSSFRSAYFRSDPLPAWSGSIQAALCLDVATDRFSKFDLLPDGVNGQMPNLDLVNLVDLMARYSGVRVTFNGKGESPAAQGDDMTAVQERMQTLLVGAARQASLQPTGPHGSFMRYRIEALTIKTVVDGYAGHNTAALASVVEGTLRSINNLLERFHQSFFFYLIAGGDRYVSIGMYMPAAALMLLPLILRALMLWFSCVGLTAQPADTGEESEKPMVSFLPLPTHLAEVATLVFVVALSSILVFVSPWLARSLLTTSASQWASEHVPAAELHSLVPLIPALLACVLTPVILSRLVSHRSSPTTSSSSSSPGCAHSAGSLTELLLCVTIVLWLAVLAVVLLINMPFAVALAIPTVPALFLMPVTSAKSAVALVPQGVLLIFISPPSLLLAALALWSAIDSSSGGGSVQVDPAAVSASAWLAWQQSAVQYELLGIWLYPLLTLCVCPLALLSWTIMCSRRHVATLPAAAHEHTD
ncbi:glycosylphosphatidylinositol anchor attachment 1 protein-like isoform X2 [Sycon ciliatum]|uniref:glycosylphosphatidylinositol anchor attachment 1 protein-like isoform X2 n=1 Tax=Sycon ciliatum TaxID=27933 RepID=UPI0031F6BD5F